MNVMKQAAIFVRTNLWIVPLVALILWGLFRFLDPAPPRTLVMTTGSEGGSYHHFALALEDRLEEEGLTLELRPSRGSIDNLERLTDGSGEVQIGLIQSGTSHVLNASQLSRLRGLAALYHEPLWLFQRSGLGVERLPDLYAHRVSVGEEGSGTLAVVRTLFSELADGARLQELNGGLWQALPAEAAAKQLKSGNLDAAFFVLPASSELLGELVAAPDLELVDLRQAEAFAARLPFLKHLTLTEGLLDIAGNFPPQDTSLLAPVATLVVNNEFHPALASLVLEAAREVLREGNLLDEPGRFPAAMPMELELTGEADYYHRNGVPFLQRYLPFWFASIVDRYVVLLIPFIVIMLPLLRSMGPLYTWRMRARVFKWYDQLRRVDKLIINNQIGGRLNEEIEGLQRLEEDLSRVDVPLSYAHELYSLHLHVRYMIKRLETMKPGAKDRDDGELELE